MVVDGPGEQVDARVDSLQTFKYPFCAVEVIGCGDLDRDRLSNSNVIIYNLFCEMKCKSQRNNGNEKSVDEIVTGQSDWLRKPVQGFLQ